MIKNTKKSKEIYDIKYNQKFLFLNCLKCNEIPYLSFNSQHPENINIKCDNCHNSSEIPLNIYLPKLKGDDLLKDKKCLNHANFLDKFCYTCHIQLCSKCEAYNQHSSHRIKTIKKNITFEDLEKVRKVLDAHKDYFKKYIFDFMNNYINKFPKNRHFDIISNLIKPYINDMKNFFLFCDCALLNYDIEYPYYYQQCNLKNFLKCLNDKPILCNLNEKKLERIFKYKNNNFVKKQNNELIIKDSFNLPNEKILNTLLIDEELIIIVFKDSLKLYNYKNKKYISTIYINVNDNNNSFDDLKLTKINRDIIAIILPISYYSSIIKICSIYPKNIILFEQKFDLNIVNINKIKNNLIGILLKDKIEIYKSSENFENISNMLKIEKELTLKFEKMANINISNIYDFIQMSTKEYIICLCKQKILVLKNNDYSIYKEIKIEEEYNNIYEINEDNFILGGRIIGILNIKSWYYNIIYNDNISSSKTSYLTGTFNKLEYSYFVLTYSNKLICRRKFINILQCHYEDVDDEVLNDERALCIFDFNPEKNTLNRLLIDTNFRIKNIGFNSKDEIIISNESKILTYYSP